MKAKKIYLEYSKHFNINELITFRGNFSNWPRKYTPSAWHYILNTRALLYDIKNQHNQQFCDNESRVFSAMQGGTDGN